MSNKKRITYADLKAKLDEMTPEQLAQPIVWSGDERGGYVHEIWIAPEDWVGDPSDHETWLPRSEVTKPAYADDYKNAKIGIPAGAIHLVVD